MKPYKYPVRDSDAPAHSVYPYISEGYRCGGSYIDNFWSLFQWHTETVNAWSMIFASVASCLATGFATLYVLDKEAVPVFVIFTLSVVLHMPFSVGNHLFMCMDPNVSNFWRKLDVIAIFHVSVLLAFVLSYFVLPGWGCLLNTLIASFIAFKASAKFKNISENHVIDGFEHAKFVGSIILCYVFPMLYALVRDTVTQKTLTISSICSIGVVCSLVSTGWCYATWWPQKMWPGRFNIFGHSHQIMHLGVMISHALQFIFLLDNWNRSISKNNID